MEPYRQVPVFDARSTPQSWSERMQPGEFAVQLSHARSGSPLDAEGIPVRDVNAAPCLIFSNLHDAEAWSRARVQANPELRCRVYDHHGMGGPPPRLFADERYVKHDGFSRSTSLRIGFALVGTGAALCTAEWISDFHLSWAAMVGTRLLPIGLLLLVTEGALRLNDWDRGRRETAAGER